MRNVLILGFFVMTLLSCKKQILEVNRKEEIDQLGSTSRLPSTAQVFYITADSLTKQSKFYFTYDQNEQLVYAIQIYRQIQQGIPDTGFYAWEYDHNKLVKVTQKIRHYEYRKWGALVYEGKFKYEGNKLLSYTINSLYNYTEGCGQNFCSPQPGLTKSRSGLYEFYYDNTGKLSKAKGPLSDSFNIIQDTRKTEMLFAGSIRKRNYYPESLHLEDSVKAINSFSKNWQLMNSIQYATSSNPIPQVLFELLFPEAKPSKSYSSNDEIFDNLETLTFQLFKPSFLNNKILSISNGFRAINYEYLFDAENRIKSISNGSIKVNFGY